MIAISSRIEVSAPTLCLNDPEYAVFQVSGTVRSADPTGHGIPDTWKCSSSLIKTLHTPPTHLYWTSFEITGYHLFLNVQVSADPYLPFRVKVHFEICQSALLRENLLSLTEFKIRFMGFSARRLVNFSTVGILSYFRLFLI